MTFMGKLYIIETLMTTSIFLCIKTFKIHLKTMVLENKHANLAVKYLTLPLKVRNDQNVVRESVSSF